MALFFISTITDYFGDSTLTFSTGVYILIGESSTFAGESFFEESIFTGDSLIGDGFLDYFYGDLTLAECT